MHKKILVFTFILFSAFYLFGQSETVYPRGAILDEEAYNSLPRAAAADTQSYDGLPSAFSLRQYAPLPGDQTEYGTCVAWAVSYAARTISESVVLNRMNQTETTQNAFSVVQVYKTIRPNDPQGWYGAQIHWALDMMTDTGAAKMIDAERQSDFPRVDLSLYDESKRYPIAGYVTLFSREDRYKPGLVTRTVKKSIAEGKPVVIGMNTPDSFFEANDIWLPKPSENPAWSYGGHAMCVVGFDDEKGGGAFEILNSWGRKWGNGGYIWIPYNVFLDYVIEGYEILENLAVYSDTVKFDGFVQIEQVNGSAQEPVPLILSDNGYYKTASVLTKGAELCITVGSGENAYIYSFAVSRPAIDNIYYTPMLIFPQTGISALLYGKSVLILPGENRTFTIGADAGVEYIITLYAKQALDIQDILRRFDLAKGNLNERLLTSIGRYFLSPENSAAFLYDENEAAFTVEPDNFRSVTALVVMIEHE